MAEREIQRTRASAHVDIDQVIARAHGWFRRAQFEDGYWWAEL